MPGITWLETPMYIVLIVCIKNNRSKGMHPRGCRTPSPPHKKGVGNKSAEDREIDASCRQFKGHETGIPFLCSDSIMSVVYCVHSFLSFENGGSGKFDFSPHDILSHNALGLLLCTLVRLHPGLSLPCGGKYLLQRSEKSGDLGFGADRDAQASEAPVLLASEPHHNALVLS